MFLQSLVSRAAPHPLTAVLVERSVTPNSMGGALGSKNDNVLAPRAEAMPDPVRLVVSLGTQPPRLPIVKP
ncbi:hypothetical protein DFH09DRAFT_1330065 [Mycena vulgaris]|nr:hypothetical protein DFH09DRAFT_1330065 [Mycena vulgaris]